MSSGIGPIGQLQQKLEVSLRNQSQLRPLSAPSSSQGRPHLRLDDASSKTPDNMTPKNIFFLDPLESKPSLFQAFANSTEPIPTLVTGVATGLTQNMSCHPIDTLKVHMQARGSSAGSVFKDLGPFGLYRGAVQTTAVKSGYFALMVGGRSFAGTCADSSVQDSRFTHMAKTFGGATGATISINAIESMKQATQLNGVSFLQHLKTQGVSVVTKAAPATFLRETGFNTALTIVPMVDDKLRSSGMYAQDDISLFRKTVSAVMVGVPAGVLTNPFDRMKSVEQAGVTKGFVDSANHIFVKDGASGFFKGASARGGYIGLALPVIFMTTDACQRFFSSGK